jgi:hypothetical protein
MVTALVVVVVAGPLLWMRARARHGLPARPRIITSAWRERSAAGAAGPAVVPEPRAEQSGTRALSAG